MKFAVAAGCSDGTSYLFPGRCDHRQYHACGFSGTGTSGAGSAIFLFAIAGAFRGFFQGHETMVPTATSQVIEQIVNAVISVVGAGVMMEIGTKMAEKSGDPNLALPWGLQVVRLVR